MKKDPTLLLSIGIITLLTLNVVKYQNYKINTNSHKTASIVETIKRKEETKEETKEEIKKEEEKVPTEKPVLEKEYPITKKTPDKVPEKSDSEPKVVENNYKPDFLETIKQRNDSLGTYGRLYLPTISLTVGVYNANIYKNENYNAQTIVDNKDSAAYYEFKGKYIIADHNYQGFSRINNLNINDKAYIKTTNNQVIIYQMKNKFIGVNTHKDLQDLNGNSIENMEGSLAMYTCYDRNNKITITLWEQVSY